MNRRRFFLGVAGGLVTASEARRLIPEAEAQVRDLAYPSDACAPTVQLGAGPYSLANSPLRSDVREDRQGVPLRLEIQVLDPAWCSENPGVMIELWQSDANGLYSGVENLNFSYETLLETGDPIDTRGTTFLRGHQIADDRGIVHFTTIFPGWYMGRIPHIHLRAYRGDAAGERTDTEMFFPKDVERAVFSADPYARRGPNPIGIDRDVVIKGDAQKMQALTVSLERDGDGYAGRFQITHF